MFSLKKILPKNPTLQDFRNSTLVYEEAQAVDKGVRSLTGVRQNLPTELGLPDFTRTIYEMRQFFRRYIKDPTEKGKFTNPESRKLNPSLQEWDTIASKRRIDNFEEVKNNHKFTKIKN